MSIARTVFTLTLVAPCAVVIGASPRMGGAMKHVMVGFDGASLHAMVDPATATPVMRDYGESYSGGASVLDDSMYNAQYGWMIEGGWLPPAGAEIWIEQTLATPGLLAYSGGTMMNQGTFSPIFGAGGSAPRIRWSGAMLHNWYASDVVGTHAATYRVYLGDAQGNPLVAYGDDSVVLEWIAQPPCDDIDFNGDGVFPDNQDVIDFLEVFAGAPCATGTCKDIDFNNDGVFPDITDVVRFFEVFAGGAC
jgi:hypothetical protein